MKRKCGKNAHRLSWLELNEFAKEISGENGKNIKKSGVSASFYIESDMFDTEKVTQTLGIIPSRVRQKGEFYSKTTVWEYESVFKEAMDIYAALQVIDAIFIPKTKELLELKKQYDLKYYIKLAISICDDEVPEFSLHPSTIKFAAQTGAEIETAIHIQPVGIYKYLRKMQEIIWYMESYTPMALWRRRQRKKLRAKIEELKNKQKS